MAMIAVKMKRNRTSSSNQVPKTEHRFQIRSAKFRQLVFFYEIYSVHDPGVGGSIVPWDKHARSSKRGTTRSKVPSPVPAVFSSRTVVINTVAL